MGGCGKEEQKQIEEAEQLAYCAEIVDWKALKKEESTENCLLMKRSSKGYCLMTEDQEQKRTLRFLDKEWNETEKYVLEMDTSETVENFYVEEKNQQIFVTSSQLRDHYSKKQFYLSAYDEQGELFLHKELGEPVDYCDIYMLEKGIFILDSDQCLLYDWEGMLQWEKKYQCEMKSITQLGEEYYVICKYNPDKFILAQMEISDGAIQEKILLFIDLTEAYIFFADGAPSPYDICIYTSKGGCYGYSLQEEENAKKLMDWGISGFSQGSIVSLIFLEDGVAVIVKNQEEHKGQVCLLTQNIESREELVFGVEMLTDTIYSKVHEYNQEQSNVVIKVKAYDQFEDSQQQLQLDIAAGEGPDILDVHNVPIDVYIKNGYLIDLYDLMGEMREELLESVLQALEKDGKLYALPPFVTVRCLVGDKKDIKTSLSWEDLKNEMKDSDGRYFAMDQDMCLGYMIESVDCQYFFTTQEGEQQLSNLFELVKELPEEKDYETIDSREKIFWEYIGSLYDIVRLDEKFGKDQWDYANMKPLVENLGKCYFRQSYSTNFPIIFSISETCTQKEEAWKFVSYFFSEQFQSNSHIYGIPVLKSALEQLELGDNMMQYVNSKSVVIKKNGKKKKRLYELLENTSNFCWGNDSLSWNLRDIIMEGFEEYRTGDKTLEQALENVQRRGKLCIAEKN